jgi:phosphohistidine phosphatase SixA
VVKELGIRDRLEEWGALAIGEDPEGVLDQLSRKDPGSTGMIVGHKPQLSEILGLLIVTGGSTRISLAKGGVAKVGKLFFRPVPSGTLEWLVTPELLIGVIFGGK